MPGGPVRPPIIGLDAAKKALTCLFVNPRLKGVLIRGPPGVGKTALARSMASAAGTAPPAILPLGASHDQVMGGVDLEHAILTGETRLEEGLLARANGTLLCVDDVNLLDRKFAHALMSAVSSGVARVERGGVSAEYPVDTSVVATMSLGGTPLGPGMADFFDMSVVVAGSRDPAFRADVAKANLDPDAWVGDDPGIRRTIEAAKGILPSVTVPDRVIDTVVEACLSFGVEGHRGELSTINAAMALAALDGRNEVSDEDVSEALFLCLGHRRARRPWRPTKEDRETVNFYHDSHIKRAMSGTIREEKAASAEELGPAAGMPPGDAAFTEAGDDGVEIEDLVLEVGERFESVDLVEDSILRGLIPDNRARRRSMAEVGRDGRYISSRPAKKGARDIAFDATFRAAAPYQRARRRGRDHDGIILEMRDVREKVRDRRVSCLFMFVVDTSGSLVIRSRIRAVKAAILSMVADHYVRRDRVAVTTFGKDGVTMVLPPTRSVGRVKGVMDDIPVGSQTPLSEALRDTGEFLSNYARKHPSEKIFAIIMTDGGGNVPIVEGDDPIEESMGIARRVSAGEVSWIVVDTAVRHGDSRNLAMDLAEALRAPYYLLDELRSTQTP
ncbi:MAG: VWA domain-containing protein [Thermoplasmatales archaeon]|nr:VWA domain-containing protein [Thermoplasmatales archaeon]